MISFSSDWLFTPRQSRQIVDALLASGKDVSYSEVNSAYGHDAFLLEPDLKESSGGLRDIHALQWASVADEELIGHDPSPLRDAYETLGVTVS